MPVLPDELQAGVGEILIDEETLQHRIDELGAAITEDYRGTRSPARRRAERAPSSSWPI